jgi:methionyl-tRNA formyltransferase
LYFLGLCSKRAAMKVILLTKTEQFSQMAQQIAREAFDDLQIYDGRVGDPKPEAFFTEKPDFLISFLSPWIVPKETLDRAGTAINFHSGSTDYPGAGCYNFALYEGAEEYGAVCHHMLAKVDTGGIIMERRFPIPADASVKSLRQAALGTMIGMFREIVGIIARGEPLPVADTHWTRAPFRGRMIDELSVCHEDMPEEEVQRRVRATFYPGYPAPVMHFKDGRVEEIPIPPALAGS